MLLIDYAGHTAPTRQHELDYTYQQRICPERSTANHEVEIDYLFELGNTHRAIVSTLGATIAVPMTSTWKRPLPSYTWWEMCTMLYSNTVAVCSHVGTTQTGEENLDM